MADLPSLHCGGIELSVRRTDSFRWAIYNQDGTPAVLEAADKVRAKLWLTNDAAPLIDVVSGGAANSTVVIDSLGVALTEPAEVTVKFHETDTGTLTAGVDYFYELFVVDNSAGNLNVPFARGGVVVNGTATGNVGP